MTHVKHRVIIALVPMLTVPMFTMQIAAGQQAPNALTPDELVQQVRAQEDGRRGATIPTTPATPIVPAPPTATLTDDTSGNAPNLPHHTPTIRDKHRLEAQLRAVDSALKIQQIGEANTQHANEAISIKGKMLFSYADGGIYEVQAATFHETAIELQPGELLTGKDLPTAGDTTRWTLTATRAGMAPNEITVLIVKPLEPDLETNMTITTNRRIYNVIMRSSEHTYMPLVGWVYPQDEARAQQDLAARAKESEDQAEPLAVAPDKLNFNCSISGSTVPWRPLRVYDDGAKTYLQMSPDMQSYEAPALFVMEKKDPLLVNYRVKHSIYIVDRLFDRAQLRVGPKSAVDIHCTRLVANR
jgi:type IV secretion system protein TrbG